MSKKAPKTPKAVFKDLEGSIREAVFDGLRQLWEDKEDKIHAFRKEDRTNKVKVGFAIDINTEESEPQIGVDITITKTIKAGMKAVCDDVDQGHFEWMAVIKPGRKPKKEKVAKGETQEPETREDNEDSES